MDSDAALSYLRSLAECDKTARARTFSRLCIDFGGDLGRFEKPWPSYLELVAREANVRDGTIVWDDDYWTSALVFLAGLAAGILDRLTEGFQYEPPGGVRDGFREIFSGSYRAGKLLVDLDIVPAAWQIANSENSPAIKGAYDAQRLVFDACEGNIKSLARRMPLSSLDLDIRLILLEGPAEIAALAGALHSRRMDEAGIDEWSYDFDPDEQNAKLTRLGVEVGELLVQLREVGDVTSDSKVLFDIYRRMYPKGLWALTTEGRRRLAVDIGRSKAQSNMIEG